MPLITNPGEVNLETAVAKGGNLLVKISYADLAAGVNNTALVLTLFTGDSPYQGFELDHVEVETPFADTSDTNNNSTAITIGDAGSAARYLGSTETNLNGSFVNLAYGTGTKYVPPTQTNAAVTATITPASGKNVANLKQGTLLAYFKVRDSRYLV